MPELPEAETIARALHKQLAGARLTRVVHLRDDIADNPRTVRTWLTGARIERVWRRGKRVLFDLDGPRTILFYLGMTGHLSVPSADVPVLPHTHLRVGLGDRFAELRFRDPRRFGGICHFDRRAETSPACLADLGLEPLDMRPRDFQSTLARARQIKALLMDQRYVAGLGNIYCDEALHRAGIHPLEPADGIDTLRVQRLYRAIRSVLRAAIRSNGTTVISYAHPDGPGNYQRKLRVYGRQDQPCRTCGTPIDCITAAGRTTHFCPQCQPGIP